ncbi:MAG TPA: UTP--glucose-1-phosphate uridylyltransferase GalU [Clostridia bacterium]|nr:UTP--glucose-1-phosphate uridylyltransferase GalU [Clostridia bacterium]
MKIRKAIIPAAGLGTRFLPATKAQPKEMLPIVDKPAIQYIIEEAVESGIEAILIITGRNKRAIEDHFDHSVELEMALAQKGEWEQLEKIKKITDLADIHYVRQKETKGLGHAIYCARRFIGQEPFAVLLGDDIVIHEEPCLKQMLAVFETYQSNIIAIRQVPQEQVNRYGIISGRLIAPDIQIVEELIEKPDPQKAPSNYAIMGRYLIQPEIFEILKDLPPGAGGEIQLTDALRQLGRTQKLFAFEFAGRRYDIGNKIGYLMATVECALNNPEITRDFHEYLLKVTSTWPSHLFRVPNQSHGERGEYYGSD